MIKTQKRQTLILTLCIIGFLLTIADFLALHDIHRDYIGTEVIRLLDTSVSEDLPAWITTKGEWDIVRVSYLFRFVFFIFCAAVLIKLTKQ